uniref:Uncharacterized protein n=1 Tax=Cacopsylla melanoneura TaxID=428564 RepID=A0A8D8YAP4_9HEMI
MSTSFSEIGRPEFYLFYVLQSPLLCLSLCLLFLLFSLFKSTSIIPSLLSILCLTIFPRLCLSLRLIISSLLSDLCLTIFPLLCLSLRLIISSLFSFICSMSLNLPSSLS